MPDDHDIPISRGDLTFTAHMALRKAEHLWPKRRLPGDRDRLKFVADAVVAHIELCGIRCEECPHVRQESVRHLGIEEATGVTRIGLAHYNTEEEVDVTLAALEAALIRALAARL